MFNRRRPTFTGVRYPSKRGRSTPIRSDTNPQRPLKLNQRDLVRPGMERQDLWWQTVHRRYRRPSGGADDPLEARAIPHWQRRGTLPERIMLKYLTTTLHFVEGVDFTFQSSLQGGRLELGGIVADFLFPYKRLVLNPAGPTHDSFVRGRLDEQQRQVLAEMGYTEYLFDDDVVYDEYRFEELMRMIFDLMPATGSSAFGGTLMNNNVVDENDLLRLYHLIVSLGHQIDQAGAQIIQAAGR